MGYAIRNGKVMKQAKPKWVTVERDEAWDRWFETVYAKMQEMFGEGGVDDEHEAAAIAALAEEGTHPPAHPCPY
jgi:hypothetical protein